ncbi:MAG: serine hydrolase [Acidimicrobiales bacterium]
MTDAIPTTGRMPALPPQPTGVAWPADDWPVGDLPAGLDIGRLVDAAFDPDGPLRDTYAVVIVQGGLLVYERYGGALLRREGDGTPVMPSTPLLSWSVAKSVLHAVVGMLVGDGRLDTGAPSAVPSWRDAGDPRGMITLGDLLEMRDGLEFAEGYEDPESSGVLRMLFGSGKADMAEFAADRPLAAPPGSRFNYSTGTSMVISGIVAREVGPGPAYQEFLDERVFTPLGMDSARATFDDAGSWVAGSYLYATARDYARFGLFYLRDGTWAGRRLLPAGWVDRGRRPRSVDPDDGNLYGAHWWTRDEPLGTFWAAGHDGQYIDVCPALDLVMVRMGRTGSDRTPVLRAWRDEVIGAFAGSLHGVAGS